MISQGIGVTGKQPEFLTEEGVMEFDDSQMHHHNRPIEDQLDIEQFKNIDVGSEPI